MIYSNINLYAFTPSPQTSRYQMPVNMGESVSLEIIEDFPRFLLISEESLIHHTSVLEFSQDQLTISHKKWTTRVTLVLGR